MKKVNSIFFLLLLCFVQNIMALNIDIGVHSSPENLVIFSLANYEPFDIECDYLKVKVEYIDSSSNRHLGFRTVRTNKITISKGDNSYTVESGGDVLASFKQQIPSAAIYSIDKNVEYQCKRKELLFNNITTLAGHKDWISSIDISKDGNMILTSAGDRDGTIRLWNMEDGRLLKKIVAHNSDINAVQFSSDGNSFISASRDESITLWDVATGKEKKSFLGHTDSVNAIQISPDGKKIVSSSHDKTVRLWEISTGKELKLLRDGSMAEQILYTSDGRRMITSEQDSLSIWDTRNYREIRRIDLPQIKQRNPRSEQEEEEASGKGATEAIIDISNDGKRLVGFLNQRNIIIWDLETGRVLKQFNTSENSCEYTVTPSLSISPDGQQLAISCNTVIDLWDLETGHVLKTLNDHEEEIDVVKFSPDGRTIVSGSRDRTIKIWKSYSNTDNGFGSIGL